MFVCLGNICRSAAAEGVFRTLAPEMEIDSAGTGNWHVGEAPYGPMQTAALARGVDLSDLRARQFLPQDFQQFQLIIVMDQANYRAVEAQRPAGCKTPVALFTSYAHGSTATDIPDPYYTRDFDGALDLIENAAAGLRVALGDLG